MIGGQKRKRPEALAVGLGILALALIVTGFAQTERVQALTTQVNTAYQKAFYETVELMGGVQLNLEKLMVTGSGAQEQKLLGDISKQCEGASSNLSVLPAGQESLRDTLKFVNQAGDYARVTGARIAGGGAMGDADADTVALLHEASVRLNEALTQSLSRFESGEMVFEPSSDAEVENLLASQDENEPTVEYPVLLYDGPFSDARTDTEAPSFGEDMDETRARDILIDYVGRDRVKAAAWMGESSIFAACYEYEMDTDDGRLTAGVTRSGGKVLYILPENDVTEAKLSHAECIDLAQGFLRSRGYGEMQVSYWRGLGGILTVNFAAVQDGVLLYPDLVKLQISMQSGQVIGVEAGNYLKNHAPRALETPAVTEEQARALIHPGLRVIRSRLCVIPLETGGEAQCWEITAEPEGGNRYLVYIDARDGREQTILQVVEGDDGVLTR